MAFNFKNVNIIKGDGSIILKKSNVAVSGDKIVAVGEKNFDASNTIEFNCSNHTIIPGIVNLHTHGCYYGPLFSSGATALSKETVKLNIEKHMSQGETSIVNVCGFGAIDDYPPLSEEIPINIYASSNHIESAFNAANLVDATGIVEKHRKESLASMVKKKAVLIGEIGSGATLGGGVSSYKYIPEIFKKYLHIEIGYQEADNIKNYLYGDKLDHLPSIDDFHHVLKKIGVVCDNSIVQEIMRELNDRIYFPKQYSLESFEEAAYNSAKYKIHALYHCASPSVETLINIAKKWVPKGAKIIAGHMNHPSFKPEECLQYAKMLKNLNVIIEASTVCCLTNMPSALTNLELLISHDVVDYISTDYGGGNWDGILEIMQYLIQKNLLSKEKAIQMITSTPASFINSKTNGIIEKNEVADLVLVNENDLSDVIAVVCEGKIVFGFQDLMLLRE